MEIPPEELSEDVPTPHRYTRPFDQWRHLPVWKRQWFEDLPEWKCEWLTQLDRRDLDHIFPTEEEARSDRESDQRFLRSSRKFVGRVGGLIVTGLVSSAVLAIGLMFYWGFQIAATRGPH